MAAPAAGSAPHPRAAPAPPAATRRGGAEARGPADDSRGGSGCRLAHPNRSPLPPHPCTHGPRLCCLAHQLGHPTWTPRLALTSPSPATPGQAQPRAPSLHLETALLPQNLANQVVMPLGVPQL